MMRALENIVISKAEDQFQILCSMRWLQSEVDVWPVGQLSHIFNVTKQLWN